MNIEYKVGDKISHKVTNDALIVFVRDKLKSNYLEDFEIVQDEAHRIMGISSPIDFADEIIETFEFERRKRSSFQYNAHFKVIKSKTKTSLSRSKSFVTEIKKLIELTGIWNESVKLKNTSSIYRSCELYF